MWKSIKNMKENFFSNKVDLNDPKVQAELAEFEKELEEGIKIEEERKKWDEAKKNELLNSIRTCLKTKYNYTDEKIGAIEDEELYQWESLCKGTSIAQQPKCKVEEAIKKYHDTIKLKNEYYNFALDYLQYLFKQKIINSVTGQPMLKDTCNKLLKIAELDKKFGTDKLLNEVQNIDKDMTFRMCNLQTTSANNVQSFQEFIKNDPNGKKLIDNIKFFQTSGCIFPSVPTHMPSSTGPKGGKTKKRRFRKNKRNNKKTRHYKKPMKRKTSHKRKRSKKNKKTRKRI